MWCDELESFTLIPECIARFKVTDRTSGAYIDTLSNGTFEAVFFCSRGLQNVRTYLQPALIGMRERVHNG